MRSFFHYRFPAFPLTLLTLLLFSLSLSPLQAQQSSTDQPATADTATADAATSETAESEPGGTEAGEEVVMLIDLPERNGDLLDAIRQRGVLQVGVSVFTPWAMRDKDGELIGFEIDVARQLADDLGVELELVPTSWSNIISDLLDGHYDIIVSGLSITPARALLVEFSRPYNVSQVLLLASKSKAGDLGSRDDFNKAEMTIGVRPETTAAAAATRAFPNATPTSFDSEQAMYEALRNGDVHAVVASSPRPNLEALRAPDQVYLPLTSDNNENEPLAVTMEGFAVRKGNQSLLNYLNSWILYHQVGDFLGDKNRYWFLSYDWEDQL